ncbi:Uncharacterised protein [Providencia rustigianii]|uniref:Uncharacterized protein n=1 Tax=Providencia rustigianii DSM 4541 TaxID=500637 RepID=D1P137_9GAMM|nr:MULTISPECIES: hypothetical protein [Providencia]EFB73056.1 hypothetical protein PROVRUST_05855 [Providencia rustigianii DSM 4541]VEB63056.1 Uncharacterised protein [Providencia rustigianii]
MKISTFSPHNFSTPGTHEVKSVSTHDLHTKMSNLWTSRNIMKDIQNYHAKNIPHISEETDVKVTKFITELQNHDNEKARFAFVFKTMINLNRSEKESFIEQVGKTLKSSSEEGSPLYKDFTKALQRYMAISLMNTPFTDQLNKNMTNININDDADDEDDDLFI